jgi:hypothetical protein
MVTPEKERGARRRPFQIDRMESDQVVAKRTTLIASLSSNIPPTRFVV